MIQQWLLIIGLAISTYISRLIGLEAMTRIKASPLVELYFRYIPASMITALIVVQMMSRKWAHVYFNSCSYC
ncbi:AzlD domain-containing protein [Geomicrobium sp. JCM 19039]|uniref:AzlD domain-containing protein n=1 Tax=Geomicrobium sp. JCM 19039 TaxID=1460636 RepID=UPI000693B8FD|nr:AzlD domain-containing protein [Geomicrobium sp. JCM 19039]